MGLFGGANSLYILKHYFCKRKTFLLLLVGKIFPATGLRVDFSSGEVSLHLSALFNRNNEHRKL